MSDSDVNRVEPRSAAAQAPAGDAVEAAVPPWPPQRPAPTAVGGDGQSLFLALFLILLALFVMLTALSRREEARTRVVLASLHSAFSAQAVAPEVLPHDPGTESAAAGAELAQLERLLAASVPLDAAVPERAGDRLLLRLPAEILFAPASTAPRRSRLVLFGRLADALAAPPAGLRVEATVTVGTPAVTAARLAGERAGALARTLAQLGAPAAGFAVGVGEAWPDEIRIALTVRPAPPAEGDGAAR